MSSYARANVRIINDKNKREIPMRASRGLKWETKMYKLKRSIVITKLKTKHIPSVSKRKSGEKGSNYRSWLLFSAQEDKENEETKEEDEEEEPLREMTLDEWKTMMEKDKPKTKFELRKAGEGEKKGMWKDTRVLKKSSEDDDMTQFTVKRVRRRIVILFLRALFELRLRINLAIVCSHDVTRSKQRNGCHLGGVKYSSGDWTLYFF